MQPDILPSFLEEAIHSEAFKNWAAKQLRNGSAYIQGKQMDSKTAVVM
jgi:hypothetical protein